MNIAFTLSLALHVLAQPPEINSDLDFQKEQIDKWVKYYGQEADRYQLAFADGEKQPLVRSPQAVFRWSNPVIGNGTTHGAMFVWTSGGRAEAVGTIFSYVPSRSADKSKRTVAGEFHSLSLRPLLALREKQPFWHPAELGIELKRIPEAPAPAKTAALRLVQMKRLARQFRAASGDGEQQRTLRLITQPLYRYRGASEDCLDGGLFCFATGTDPELLMVVEARKTGAGFQWHFAAGRFSHLTLRLDHEETPVWSYLRGVSPSRGNDPTNRYFGKHGIAVRERLIP